MIFPDWGTAPAQETGEALPLFREWAVDWENGCFALRWDTGAFALRDGKPYLVSGDEALKLWITKALNPESRRFFYTAWSWDYGNELETLLGGCVDQGILESQARQSIRDALLVSPYIRSVDGFSFEKRGSAVTVRFTVRTVYGSFDQTTEVMMR